MTLGPRLLTCKVLTGVVMLCGSWLGLSQNVCAQSLSQLTSQGSPLFSTPIPAPQNFTKSPKPFKGSVLEVVEYEAEANSDPNKQAVAGAIPEHLLIDTIELVGNQYYRDEVVNRALSPITKTLSETSGEIDTAQLKSTLEEINQRSPFKLQGQVVSSSDSREGRLLKINVYEPNPWQITLTSDNQGRPGLGYYRWATEISNSNLTGWGDKLLVQYIGATRTTLGRVTYTSPPLNRRNGTLEVGYTYQYLNYDTSQVQLVPPYDDINSDAHISYLQFKQPLDKQQAFSLYSQLRYSHFDRWDNREKTTNNDTAMGVLGLEARKKDRLGETTADFNSTYGSASDISRQNYFRQRLALRRVFKLPSDNQLTFRFIGQYSNDFLPIGRDLSLGGAYAIRGYTEGLINGDRGVFGSVEHQWPVPGLGKISSKTRQSIRGVTFFDIGQAWLDNTNTRFRQGLSNDVNRTLLASIGVGLRFRVTQYLQGFVDAGYGLFDRNLVEIASQPSVRVHFGFRSDLLPQPMVEHLAHHHMLFNRSSLHDQ